MCTDYILSSIEKFTFFEYKSDYLPKFRLFNIVGMAAGFSFNTDDLIKANIDHHLVGYSDFLEFD